MDLSYETVSRWYFEYLSLDYKSKFVHILENYTEYLPFFIEIAEKMKRGELFKENVDYMLANLICCRASQDRKAWLEHENRCLEAQNKILVEENTRLDENNKARLSYHPNKFTSLSEDS